MFMSLSVVANSDAKAKLDLENKIELVQNRLSYLEQQVDENNSEIRSLTNTAKNNALPLVLFAFFCAWWAKSSGRSPLLWFFLGLLFHVFTAIALVIKTESKT
jgi:hypothetical protein